MENEKKTCFMKALIKVWLCYGYVTCIQISYPILFDILDDIYNVVNIVKVIANDIYIVMCWIKYENMQLLIMMVIL